MENRRCERCVSESESYRQQGTVVSTNSNEFPHIIRAGSKLYLFPSSLYFVEPQEMTKSMKSRMAQQMLNGTSIEFEADCHNIVVNYARDQSNLLRVHAKPGPDAHIAGTGVFSPEMPRRCWSDQAGLLDVSTDLMKLIPNVAYKITIRCCASLKDSKGGLPIPQMRLQLGDILEPIHDETAVSEAPWNLNSRVFFYMNSDSPQYDSGPQPQRIVKKSILRVVDNNQLVNPALPKYMVVMGVANFLNKKELKEGLAIKADMFFSLRNQFYVVYHYNICKSLLPLKTKQVVDDSEPHIEYRVDLTRSSKKGFFVCSEFNFCLVEDNRKVLACAASNLKRYRFPAWIRLSNQPIVAKFFVSSTVSEYYSERELWSNLPLIKTDGFLINNQSGFVFSQEYPLNRFVLLSSDKFAVQVGDWMHIEATYFHEKDIYLVLKLSPINSRISVTAFSSVHGYLFEDNLSCSNIKVATKVYNGDLFGLVTDTEDMVMDKVKKSHRNVWPTEIRVLLRENTDRSNSVAFNIAYIYPFDMKELEANEQFFQKPTRKWWKTSSGIRSCLCREAREIATDIIEVSNYQVQETATFDKLKKLLMY